MPFCPGAWRRDATLFFPGMPRERHHASQGSSSVEALQPFAIQKPDAWDLDPALLNQAIWAGGGGVEKRGELFLFLEDVLGTSNAQIE